MSKGSSKNQLFGEASPWAVCGVRRALGHLLVVALFPGNPQQKAAEHLGRLREGDPLREKAKGEQCPVSVPPGQ